MGLGERVRRLLPACVLTVAAAGIIAFGQWTARKQASLEARLSQTEREERSERGKKREQEWFLLGTGLSLFGLGLAHAVKRVNGQKPTLLQPAVEHPALTGAVAAFSYGAAAGAVLSDPMFVALGAALGGVPAYALAWGCSHVKPNYLINLPRAAVDSVCGLVHELITRNPAKRQRVLERMRAYVTRPEQVDVDLVDVLFQQEKVDEALDLLKTLVPRIDAAVEQNALDQNLTHPLAAETQHLLFGNRNPFTQMFSALRQGSMNEALAALDAFVEGGDPSRFAARAYTIQTLADRWPALQQVIPRRIENEGIALEQRAQEAWQDAIATILAVPGRERDFRLMGESRNEVLEYASNPFLQGLLVFKRCDLKDKQRLQRERENIPHMRDRLGPEVAKSLAYVEHDGKAYHVTRHETGMTLEHALQNASHDECVRRIAATADLLARIHLVPPLPPSEFAHADYYADRLREKFYEPLAQRGSIAVASPLLEALRAVGRRVYQELRTADIGQYKDANPRNWLVAEQGVIAIDFEHNALLPVQLDLVSLLEFGPAPTSFNAKRAAFHNYFRAFYAHKQVDHKRFFRHYRWAAVQRHLELAGYRARDKEYAAAQWHVSRARHYAAKLGESALAGQLGTVRITGAAPSAGH